MRPLFSRDVRPGSDVHKRRNASLSTLYDRSLAHQNFYSIIQNISFKFGSGGGGGGCGPATLDEAGPTPGLDPAG